MFSATGRSGLDFDGVISAPHARLLLSDGSEGGRVVLSPEVVLILGFTHEAAAIVQVLRLVECRALFVLLAIASNVQWTSHTNTSRPSHRATDY